VGWCGRAFEGLSPLIERSRAEFHAAATCCMRRTRRSGCWTRIFLREQRGTLRVKRQARDEICGQISKREPAPWAGGCPLEPSIGLRTDWKERACLDHLANAAVSIQARVSRVIGQALRAGPDGIASFTRGFLLAHLRRDFNDFLGIDQISEIAREGADRVGKLYGRLSANQWPAWLTVVNRGTVQKFPACRRFEAFFTFGSEQQLFGSSGKEQFWPRAFQLWPSTVGKLQLVPGRRSLWPSTINPAERACDHMAREERNWLFCGATRCRNTRPAIRSIENAKLNGLKPTGFLD